MTYYPTAEQVAVAWLKTVDGVDATKVATSLPADASVWAAAGFVRATVVGGSPATDTALYAPVLAVDCWAANLNSSQPPWGRAGSLAAAVVAATYAGGLPLLIDPGEEFHQARLHTVQAVAEPRRVPQDEAGFARVTVDLLLTWSAVPR